MEVLRISAFTDGGGGGNPAGVVIGDELPPDAEMQRVAADVGYSETAFAAVQPGSQVAQIRYFSPEAEVTFCGHATIATAVALADLRGPGMFEFDTRAGRVPVETRVVDGEIVATLTSVTPEVRNLPDDLLDALLVLLHWNAEDIDEDVPPALGYAGAWHVVMGVRELAQLEALDYDFAGMRALMQQHDLTTLQLVHRVSPLRFRSRNPFPVGGVVEDPATGAAAAALGAYLRARGIVEVPAEVVVQQGVEMGRPSLIKVTIPDGTGGVSVTGSATRIEG